MSTVRAPELAGRWVGGRGPTLRSLRGRVVLLHLMTTGCVNCVHVVDELRPVAARHPDLVVLGVLSPKFPHEAAEAPAARALDRIGVDHPVLLDPDRRTWDAYAAKAWPTLVVVDQAGYVVHTTRGEGHAAEVEDVVTRLLDDGGTPAAAPTGPVAVHGLRHPTTLVATPEGTLLVADTGHAAVVELAPDLRTELARHTGPFRDVTGLALLPRPLAAELGHDVVLADRLGQQVHLLDRATGRSRVLAGTGSPWRYGDPDDGALSSPTALVLRPGTAEVVVAQAGNHTLAALDLRTGAVRRVAGRVTEGLGDDAALEAFLAQPSGLAERDGAVLFVDAESSSLRRLADGRVTTLVGEGLFDFGDADGPPARARLQHPEGLTLAPDGAVLVADTYNGSVRRVTDRAVSTLATGLLDPRGIAVLADRVVVTSGDAVLDVGPAACELAPDARLVLELPDGVVVDGPVEVRVDGRAGDTLERGLTLAPGTTQLCVQARVAVCEADLCRVVERTWTLPVSVTERGARDLRLRLG